MRLVSPVPQGCPPMFTWMISLSTRRCHCPMSIHGSCHGGLQWVLTHSPLHYNISFTWQFRSLQIRSLLFWTRLRTPLPSHLFVIWLERVQYYIWVFEVSYTNILFLWMWWHLLVSLVYLFGITWFHSELAGALLADCSSINNFLGVCYSYFGSWCKLLHVHFFCITCEVGIPFLGIVLLYYG